MTFEELQALPVGAEVAYRKRRWKLTEWHLVGDFLEPVFMTEDGDKFSEGIYASHLMKLLDS